MILTSPDLWIVSPCHELILAKADTPKRENLITADQEFFAILGGISTYLVGNGRPASPYNHTESGIFAIEVRIDWPCDITNFEFFFIYFQGKNGSKKSVIHLRAAVTKTNFTRLIFSPSVCESASDISFS